MMNALINSSMSLYNLMLSAVVKAQVLFFDTNPVGRALNRFSRDINIMEQLLPEASMMAFQEVLCCIGVVILQSVLVPWAQLFDRRNANLGFNFNPGLFFFSSKGLSRIIFYSFFRVSSHQIVGKEN